MLIVQFPFLLWKIFLFDSSMSAFQCNTERWRVSNCQNTWHKHGPWVSLLWPCLLIKCQTYFFHSRKKSSYLRAWIARRRWKHLFCCCWLSFCLFVCMWVKVRGIIEASLSMLTSYEYCMRLWMQIQQHSLITAKCHCHNHKYWLHLTDHIIFEC